MDVAAERRDVSEQGAQRVHHALGEPAAKQRRDERRRAGALRQSRAESLGQHTQAHERLVAAGRRGRRAPPRAGVSSASRHSARRGSRKAAIAPRRTRAAAEADEGGGAELGAAGWRSVVSRWAATGASAAASKAAGPAAATRGSRPRSARRTRRSRWSRYAHALSYISRSWPSVSGPWRRRRKRRRRRRLLRRAGGARLGRLAHPRV